MNFEINLDKQLSSKTAFSGHISMQHRQFMHTSYSNSWIVVSSIKASIGQLLTHVMQLLQSSESIAGLDQNSFIKPLAIDEGIVSSDPAILGGHLKSYTTGGSPIT